MKIWADLAPLEHAFRAYLSENGAAGGSPAAMDAKNQAQKRLRATYDPFFTGLHDCLKQVDKAVHRHEKTLAEQAKADGRRQSVDRATRQLKTALEALHAEVNNAEGYFGHIRWLQERFPEGRYEDVTGLCKLAAPEEVKEQDYSLNPGRYVGVMIEEDGKTEEEFVGDLSDLGDQLRTLDLEATHLVDTIYSNLDALLGES